MTQPEPDFEPPMPQVGPGPDWSSWPAPAKLNLFLRILGRRADGDHDLQTVFRLLDWGDRVHLRTRGDGRIVRHGGLPGLREDEDLGVIAARTLQMAAGSHHGADIRIEKSIPAGAGFGGGSSDAATVLVALNLLWAAGLDASALSGLGSRIGADVPVFVGGRSAWGEGIGDRLTPIDLPEAWYVLVDPGVHASTAELFGRPELTRQGVPTTMDRFLAGDVADNAFEPVLRGRHAAVDRVFELLSVVGKPKLTGSGSGVFVEFATHEAARAALAVLPGGLRAWLARGVSVSPLQGAVEAWRTRVSQA